VNCTEAQKQCQPFLDGQLEAPLSAQVGEHLAQCGPCAQSFAAERKFHGLLKNTLCSEKKTSAPDALRRKIQIICNNDPQPAASAPLPSPRFLSPRGPMATAAAIMLAFSGLMVFQSICILKQCPLVMAAQSAHDKIVAGANPLLTASENPQKLTKYINDQLEKKFAGVPNLTNCKLKPVNCGKVKIDGLPEGVFVKFVECNCDETPLTLMVVDSSTQPGGTAHGDVVAAKYASHNVLSWKSEKDGLLYIVVTKLPLSSAMHVAEVARR
jgi:hypothetical protein